MTRDGDGVHDDAGGRARARGHRGASRGCGRCSCCRRARLVGRTRPTCPNTVCRLSLKPARPLVAENSEPANKR